MPLLPSAPIDQFEEASNVQPDDWTVIFQRSSGKTLKTKSSNFGIDSPSSNYNWSSTFDYDVDAVVDYQGKWYKSLVTPNLNNVPTASGSTYWEVITKSAVSSIAVWAPGTYVESNVFVMYDLNQNPASPDWGMYALKTPPARPYVSTDFVSELASGTWTLVFGGSPTELGRAFDETVLFDKENISYAKKVMDDDIDFSLATSGNVTTVLSTVKMVIETDGIHAVNFDGNFDFKYGISNGQVLEAGTYQFWMVYDPTFGTVTVSVPDGTSEGSTSTTLATPGSFAAAAIDENNIGLSWADVANELSYLIEASPDGVGSWATQSTPAANAVSATESGLSPAETRYYRIKAIGNGTTYLDSSYAYASATTADAGDVDEPVPTFSPVAAATDIPVNQPIIITFDEEIYNDSDGSDIANNQAGVVILKETNGAGADIPCTWTIDGTKKIITITPTNGYGGTQLVYVAVDNFEDINGNATPGPVSSTFTTNDYSIYAGNNASIAGDTLDSLFGVNDTNFWLEITVKGWDGVGAPSLVAKYSNVGSQVTFYLTIQGSDVFFAYFGTSMQRRIKWTGAITVPGDEMSFVLKYDGAIDTASGLDRGTLIINGVTKGSKSLDITAGSLSGTLKNTTAQLSAGATSPSSGVPESNFLTGMLKNLIIRSTGGTVVEVNIPILKEGTDISGNGHHATWV